MCQWSLTLQNFHPDFSRAINSGIEIRDNGLLADRHDSDRKPVDGSSIVRYRSYDLGRIALQTLTARCVPTSSAVITLLVLEWKTFHPIGQEHEAPERDEAVNARAKRILIAVDGMHWIKCREIGTRATSPTCPLSCFDRRKLLLLSDIFTHSMWLMP